jgi:phage gp16-like protein
MSEKTQKEKTTEKRRRLLAAVHVAKKQLGLDDDTYRDVLRSFGHESAAAFSDIALMELLRHFERCGFKNPAKGKECPPNFDKQYHRRRLSKIKALLTVGKKPWSYADAIGKQMWGIDKVQWLDGEQMDAVTVALIKHGKRAGWAVK